MFNLNLYEWGKFNQSSLIYLCPESFIQKLINPEKIDTKCAATRKCFHEDARKSHKRIKPQNKITLQDKTIKA